MRFGVRSGYVTGVRVDKTLHVARTYSANLSEADFVALDAELAATPLPPMPLHGVYSRLIGTRLDYRDGLPPIEALFMANTPGSAYDLTAPAAVMSITQRETLDSVFGDAVFHARFQHGALTVSASSDELLPALENKLVKGYIVEGYGLLTFGDTAQESYDCQQEILARATAHLNGQNVTLFDFGGKSEAPHTEIAALRKRLSDYAGRPLMLMNSTLPTDMPLDGIPDAVFVTAADTALTRRTLVEDITAAPDDARVIYDAQRGLFTAGENVDKAARALDIAQRGAQVIGAANQLGGYTTPDISEWADELPQQERTPRQYDGEIVLITGAASGIGKGTAEVFLEQGAAVVGLDINPAVCTTFDTPQFLGIVGDVRVARDVHNAVEESVRAFGGIDVVFLNAGINEDHSPLEKANMDLWRWVMDTNVDGNMIVLKAVYEVLKQSPKGGRVVMNASKSAPAPGPGSSSYTVSKAAITQLGRLTALEWGKDNIRVYVVHPNAVFDTLIWKNNMAEKRAKHYGMTLQQYKTNNLLKVEITSRDVGEVVAELCGDHFRKTTGVQVPIDGGNNRVI